MKFVDRLLTIVVTATITSMVWIVAGGSLMEMASSDSQLETTRPAEAAPSPEASATDAKPTVEDIGTKAAPVAALDESVSSNPSARDAANLLIPVLNVRPSDLSDSFSQSGEDGARLHEAIDIMAPEGTSVVSSAPGTVEKLHPASAGGNAIYVRSVDGLTIYYYANLDGYADGLREGQRVRRGQRLGTVGASANRKVDAPHLHFAILRTTADAQWWEPANAVNPYPILTN